MAEPLPTAPRVSTVSTHLYMHCAALSTSTVQLDWLIDAHSHGREGQDKLQALYMYILTPSDFNGLSCDPGCGNISFTSVPTTTYNAATSTVSVDYTTSVPSRCGCRAKSARRFTNCKSVTVHTCSQPLVYCTYTSIVGM